MTIVDTKVIKIDSYYSQFSVPNFFGPGKYNIKEIRITDGSYELWGVYLLLGGTISGNLVSVPSTNFASCAPQHIQDLVQKSVDEQLRMKHSP